MFSPIQLLSCDDKSPGSIDRRKMNAGIIRNTTNAFLFMHILSMTGELTHRADYDAVL